MNKKNQIWMRLGLAIFLMFQNPKEANILLKYASLFGKKKRKRE